MPLTAPRYEIAIGSSSYRGIQTIRNWPGCPPKSPRKRYVIVVGVSRTSSRIGTTSNLGMGDPDRFRDGAETGFLEERRHLLRDLLEHGDAFRDDRHRLHRVDRDDPVGPALLRSDGERSDVLHVGGQLREDRQ